MHLLPATPSAPTPVLLASTAAPAAAGGTGGPGSAAGTSGGWLYSLLLQSGVSSSTAHTVVEFVVRPLEVVLVVVVAALVAHYGARALRRLLGQLAHQAANRAGAVRGAPSAAAGVPGAPGTSERRGGARVVTVVALIGNLWRLFVAVVAVAIILGMLGIDLTPLLASATVIGATIGFGAQSLVRDYLSGILLTMEDQFGIGDTITVATATGVVEDLSLRVTRLRSDDGSVWYVPNGDIRTLTNSSRGWAKAVVEVPVSPAAAGDLDRVKDEIAAAARQVARLPLFAPSCTEAPEVVGMTAADSDTCTVRVALRTTPLRRAALERTLREAVVARLTADGSWPGLPAGGQPSPGPGRDTTTA